MSRRVLLVLLAAALSLPLGDAAWARPNVPGPDGVPAAAARAIERGYHRLPGTGRTTPARPGRSAGTKVSVPGAEAVAYDASTQTVYVPSETSNTIAVVDARTCNARRRHCRAPVATLPTGNEPFGVVVDPTTHTLWLANHGDSDVAAYDLRRCSARLTTGCGPAAGRVPVPDRPTTVALDTRRHTAYAGSDGTRVSVLDTSACNGSTQDACAGPVATVEVGRIPLAPYVDPSTDTLYVPRAGDDPAAVDAMAVVDLRTCNAITRTGCATAPVSVRVGDGAIFAAADPRTHTLYVSTPTSDDNSSANDTVSVLDQSTCSARDVTGCDRAVVATIAMKYDPQVLALDRQSKTLYVTGGLDVVSAVDVRRCNATSTAGCTISPRSLQADGEPFDLALSPRSGTLYLAARADGTLAALDAPSCSALRTDGCRREAPTSPAGGFGNTVDALQHTYYQPIGDRLGMLDTRTCNGTRLSGCGRPLLTASVGKEYGVVFADADDHTLYANDQEAGRVDIIDTRTCNSARLTGCAPLASVPVPELNDIWVNQTTDTVYLPQNTGTITILRGRTCNAGNRSGCAAPLFSIRAGEELGAAWIDERTNTFYIHAADDAVLVLPGAACDAGSAACRVVGQTRAGPGIIGIWGDEVPRTLYAANFGEGSGPGTISVIDLRRCQSADTTGCGRNWPVITTPRGPFGIEVLPDTHQLVVTHFVGSTVSFIDVRRCTGSDHRRCSPKPRRIAVGQFTADTRLDTRRHTVYVLNSYDRTVNVIDYRHPCRTGLCFR